MNGPIVSSYLTELLHYIERCNRRKANSTQAAPRSRSAFKEIKRIVNTYQQTYNHSTQTPKGDDTYRHQPSFTQQISSTVGTIHICPLHFYNQTESHNIANKGRRLAHSDCWTSRQLPSPRHHVIGDSILAAAGSSILTYSHQLANSTSATTNRLSFGLRNKAQFCRQR